MGIVKIELIHDRLTDMKKSEFNAIARKAFKRIGDYWIKEYLPKHFQRGNKDRYNHDPRGSKYLRWRKFYANKYRGGQDVDLVLSGASKTDATTLSHTVATATHATVKIPAKKLNFHPFMRREVTTVTPDEMKVLEKLFDDTFEKEFAKAAKQVSRRKSRA